ncbi:MAG TPA: M48 family metalloprotease [Candidatus Paceibacterota bacterium]|nr:M48 family metalloprotease [Candidatus Paceibacterota bacterium]
MKSIRLQSLAKSLILPVLVLIFFLAAIPWYGSKIRSVIVGQIQSSSEIPFTEKAARVEFIERVDFTKVCLQTPPPDLQILRAGLDEAGITTTFKRLQWGRYLSFALVGMLGLATVFLALLNKQASQSQDALIRCYRLGWKIAMSAALAKVILLIPLLTYGSFELTVLLADRYYPKLLIVIVLGGIIALWHSASILLRKIPLEFQEPMAREITPEQAPALWEAVREAAARLQTAPPDSILIGMQLNFYVTELTVKHEFGQVNGRTLFLSFPLLKQLSREEVLAIIGHELGHFIGADTRLTREFFPMRLKVDATMMTLAKSGWVAWPSSYFLHFFSWCFGETEQTTSRKRELLADSKAAEMSHVT